MYSAFISALASDLQGLLPPAGQNLTSSDLQKAGKTSVNCNFTYNEIVRFYLLCQYNLW